MKVANRNDIIELCNKHKRVKDNKHEAFKISPVVLNALNALPKWPEMNYIKNTIAKVSLKETNDKIIQKNRVKESNS